MTPQDFLVKKLIDINCIWVKGCIEWLKLDKLAMEWLKPGLSFLFCLVRQCTVEPF